MVPAELHKAEAACGVRHKQDLRNSKVGLMKVVVKRWLVGWMDGCMTPTLSPSNPHEQIHRPPSVTVLFRTLPLLRVLQREGNERI